MAVSIIATVVALFALLGGEPMGAKAVPESPGFSLTSGDIKHTFSQAQILNTFGCSGGNQSPNLSWTGVPPKTQSLALTMFDQDAPTGSGWWHWVVVDIPASATELPTGASGNEAKMPAGAHETRTDFGKPGYGGPCPPPGAPHRYVFTLHALKVPKLGLDPQASGAMASFMIRQNSVDSATFTATYSRK
jgi:Raf kinase inhibitor-like YbhB/YbcL family protein